MSLKVEAADSSNAPVLLRYCAEHSRDHDDSFVAGRDFSLGPDYPAYLLREDGRPAGAVILMRTPRQVSVRRGRFSILHAESASDEAYAELLRAIRPHTHGLQTVYLFLPEAKAATAAILTRLGFTVERTSFVLVSDASSAEEVSFPDGFVVRPLTASDQDGLGRFADCVNRSFRPLAGHIDSSADDIRAMFEDTAYLEEGICVLGNGGEAVGTLCVTREQERPGAAEIGGLSIADAYRGSGLGRRLLRYGLALAARKGLHPVLLSVNAENEAALGLYRAEGFVPIEKMICYAMTCPT
jgi:mycothiol synthase